MDDLVTYPNTAATRLAFASTVYLKKSLRYFTVKDLRKLEAAFDLARRQGLKTKSFLIGRRIRQLKKRKTI